MIYKRLLAITLAIIAILFMVGCEKQDSSSIPPNNPQKPNDQTAISDDKLFVDFIDVGQGDSILITFMGGDNLLIDCGNGSELANQNIEKALIQRKIDKIDYFVLTHPDADHVGGTKFITQKCQIGKVFLPYIYYLDNFPTFKNARESLIESSSSVTYSVTNLEIVGDNYFIKFLSPANKDFPNSSYNQINRVDPTDSQTNNVSPIIYVESQGVKMVFTGDAEKSQEEYVISNYKVGIYGSGANAIDLNDIDLLKVAHHGSNDCSSSEFLELLKPNNAVISVGGDNIYGHPSARVIERLMDANENCNIYRTDAIGTISFTINEGTFTRI